MLLIHEITQIAYACLPHEVFGNHSCFSREKVALLEMLLDDARADRLRQGRSQGNGSGFSRTHVRIFVVL